MDSRMFFPQWQGAGDPRIFLGAGQLFSVVGQRENWQIISVDGEKTSGIEKGIRNFSVIQDQLGYMTEVLQRNQPDRLLTLGGDCSVSIPAVRYLQEKLAGNLTVVWLDAHGDLNCPEESLSQLFHGMPLRQLLEPMEREMTIIQAEQLVMVGVRELDAAEEVYIQQKKISVLSPEAWQKEPERILQLIRERGRENVYIHLDMDICDPDDFRFAACPTYGGLKINQLCQLLDNIGAAAQVVGLSMVEFIPGDEKGQRQLLSILEQGEKLLFGCVRSGCKR